MLNPVELPLPRKFPQQARSRDLVSAIEQATAQLIDRHGIESVTTNGIATRAGVSIGSLYQYFPNKEAILTSMLMKAIAYWAEKQRVIAQECAQLPAHEAIRHFVRRCIRTRETIYPTSVWKAIMEWSYGELTGSLYEFFHAQRRSTDLALSGIFGRTIDPELSKCITHGAGYQFRYWVLRADDDARNQEFEESLVRIMEQHIFEAITPSSPGMYADAATSIEVPELELQASKEEQFWRALEVALEKELGNATTREQVSCGIVATMFAFHGKRPGDVVQVFRSMPTTHWIPRNENIISLVKKRLDKNDLSLHSLSSHSQATAMVAYTQGLAHALMLDDPQLLLDGKMLNRTVRIFSNYLSRS